MRRLLGSALALTGVVALVAAGPGSGATAAKTITGTVGPGFTITVSPKSVKAGTYTIVIRDKSSSHNWHITGPGVNKATTVGGTGTITWKNVKLKKGTYRIVCDPHATTMKTTLKVT